MNCEPGIYEFLRRRDTSKGKVWRAHPRLARSIPFGSAFLSDGTQIQAIKMQNMRNTPSPEAPLERGRTYVSLGFVDLQQLMEAEVRGPTETGRSVAWQGYDMNPIAVAKAKLIVAMLKEEVPLVQILQIWFSTAITSETAKTLTIFSKKLRLSEKHGELQALLCCWSNSSSIRTETSSKAWKERLCPKALLPIQLLVNKRDRVEYAR